MPFSEPAIFPAAIAGVADLYNQINFKAGEIVPSLASGISSSSTSMVLVTGTGANLPTNNFVVTLEGEIIFVGSRSGDVCSSCVRGVEGTTAAAHLANTQVNAFITAKAHNQLASEVNAIETALGVNLGSSNGQVIFNNSGAFGGDANFTWTPGTGLDIGMTGGIGGSITINDATSGSATLAVSGSALLGNAVPFASLSAEAQLNAQSQGYAPMNFVSTSQSTAHNAAAGLFLYDVPDAAAPFGPFGINGIVVISPVTNIAGSAWGITGQGYGGGTGNYTQLGGITSYSEWDGTGTLSELVGCTVAPNFRSQGTVTLNVGIHIQNQGGVGTTNYALLIDDQTVGADNWAIKTGLGLVQLDNGTSDASNKFSVVSGSPISIITYEEYAAISGNVSPASGFDGSDINNFVCAPILFGNQNSAIPGRFINLYMSQNCDASFTGTLATAINVYAEFPNRGSGSVSGTIGTYIDYYGGDLGVGFVSITNPYYSWFDSRGVRRVKEDASHNSVGQAIEALYNPQFTKYTPGAANFERVILGQWDSNVAQIGTEAGGTGTLRGLELIGASVKIDGSIGFFGGAPATKQTVTGAKLPSDTVMASLLAALVAYGLIIDSTT